MSELLGAILAQEEFVSLASRGHSEIKDDLWAPALEICKIRSWLFPEKQLRAGSCSPPSGHHLQTGFAWVQGWGKGPGSRTALISGLSPSGSFKTF